MMPESCWRILTDASTLTAAISFCRLRCVAWTTVTALSTLHHIRSLPLWQSIPIDPHFQQRVVLVDMAEPRYSATLSG